MPPPPVTRRTVSGPRHHRVTAAGAGILTAALLASCQPAATPELERVELFELGIGPMEDQIDLFRVGGGAASSTDVFVRDGLFYLANGHSEKIMQLSSFGDLILLIYDPASNPEPVGVGAAGATATRVAVPHEFNELGHVVVDSERRLYAQDTVDQRRWIRDAEYGVVLKRAVLRFSRRGELVDILGQEGVGGTPFPFIQRLGVGANDGLAVVTRTPDLWVVYWFDPSGRPRMMVELPHRGLLRGARDPAIVWDVFPNPVHPTLSLFVDRLASDSEAGAEGDTAGGEREPDRRGREVWQFDANVGAVVGRARLPDPRRAPATVGTATPPAPTFYPLGVTDSGHVFMVRREDDQFHLLTVLTPNGRVTARRRLHLEEQELTFSRLGMTTDGVVYAILGGQEVARMVWWRGDRLIDQQAPP